MFDIGFWEIVVVLVVALIVVGPEKLPGLARNVGLWVAIAQRKIAEVRGEVERELNLEELRRSVAPPEALKEMRQLADRMKSLNTEIQADVRRATLLNAASANAATSSEATTATTASPPVTEPPLAPGESPLAESAEPTPIQDVLPTASPPTVSTASASTSPSDQESPPTTALPSSESR